MTEPSEHPAPKIQEEAEEEPKIGQQPEEQADILLSQPFLIARNPIALNVRFIIAILLIEIAFLLLLGLISLLGARLGSNFLVLFIILLLLKLIFLFGLLVKLSSDWTKQSYFLTEKQFIKRKGITSVQEDTYELEDIRHVTMRQDALGRLFDYGHLDIVIAVSGMQEHLKLSEVKDPGHYKKIFERYLE